MEKEFIPYEEALALKELGFEEPCMANYNTIPNAYSEDGDHKLQLNYCLYWDVERVIKEGYTHILRTPTFSQAFRWFREKYGLTWEHQFDDGNISLYVGVITYPDNALNFFKTIEVEYDGYNKAYEETELECLKKLIEIVNNK